MQFKDNVFIIPHEEGYLLYNPYTDAIKYLDSIDMNEKQKEELINEGVLLPKDVNGPAIARYIINTIKHANETDLQITDAFSYRCNLKCVYCMQQNIHEVDRRMKPYDRVKEWKNLMGIHNANKLNVCLFGGEPFFNIPYIEELLKIAKDEIGDIRYSVVTNGTLIDQRVLDLIKTYNINRIQITIDGPERIHNLRRTSNDINSFQTIISNIHKILNQTKATIIINSVIDTANYDNIDESTDFLIQEYKDYIFCDSPRIIFNYGMECHPFGKSSYTKEHIPELKQYYQNYLRLFEKEIKKGIATTEIMPSPVCIAKDPNDILIAPNGDIYKCISALGVSEFKICDYNEIQHNKMLYIEKLVSFSNKTFESCVNCRYLALCNGGCFYEASIENIPQACRKEIMNVQMPYLIRLRYMSEEIESGVFRIHDYNHTNR